MSKASDAANAVVNAAAQVLDLYGVRYTREQSRVIQVEGAAGRWRPMFFGQWVDDFGVKHNSGKADLLARPRIWAATVLAGTVAGRISVPLWIECKAGKGRLSPDQIAFKNWVEANGDEYMLIHDDVRPLITWLDEHGVVREPHRIIHSSTPMNVDDLHALPCRHCGKSRGEHIGVALGCPGKSGHVWSPDLKVKA